jgi:hypothetical protein
LYRNDISEIIENSLGSSQSTLHPSSSSSSSSEPESAAEDCVFACDAAVNADARVMLDEKVLNISSQLAGVSFHSPTALQLRRESSPLTRSQLRRQSDTFEFARPSERRLVHLILNLDVPVLLTTPFCYLSIFCFLT